jgi:hypothetical protein
MSTVKCKYCGESIDKELAFKEEYLTKSMTVRNRYFCNEDECDKYHKQQEEKELKEKRAKEMKKEAREMCRSLCGLGEKEKSIYFSSTYKILTDKFDNELIYEYTCKNEKDIMDLLDSKDFKTSASRIKYCLVMLENQLERYQVDKEEPKIEPKIKEVEVDEYFDDFDIVVNVKKKEKRRNINDILGL